MRLLSLVLLAAGLAGCATIDDLYREVERYPREWSRDLPDYRRGGDAVRVRRDVNRYVREVDRAVRLDSRQERRIADRLEDRAYRYLDRRSNRDRRDYPFPRDERASREVEDWWRGADRDVERELSRRQREDYREFVRRFDDRYDRYDRDDDDWDDDEWDDD